MEDVATVLNPHTQHLPRFKLELEVPAIATTAGPAETTATTPVRNAAAKRRGIKTTQTRRTKWGAHPTHLHELHNTIV